MSVRPMSIAAAMLLTLGGTARAQSAGRPAARARTDARVEALLRQMTIEEKVGQMTQLTIQAVSATRGLATVSHVLDSLRLDSAIVNYGVGSMLNVYDVAYTPQHWREVIAAIQRSAQRSRLKIPVLYGIDAVHGFHYMVGGTIFPQSIAMAATWNPALVRRTNQVTAYETRAAGIPWNFSPVLDLGRQPLWSRFQETFGEDPYLASALGVAAVTGEQRDPRASLDSLLGAGQPARRRGRSGSKASPVRALGGDVFVAATGKHYLGYSAPLNGKDRSTAWLPDRALQEYYVPSFRAAIDAGLRTVMVNSGDINGVPVHASHEILTDLLRGQLGFTGVAVSDWEDIVRLHTVHHVAATEKEAVRMAVMAGVDMSMVPYNLSFHHELLELVREGAVPRSRIDEAVRRILTLKFELGLFENAVADSAMLSNVGAPAFRAVSRTAAEESITLLKNDGATLPLARTARVLLTGPGATSLPATHGSWTYTWQGTDTTMYPKSTRTVLAALQAKIGAGQVTYVPGASFDAAIDVPAAVAAARNADVVVVALAEFPMVEKPGDINALALPAAQIALARALEATGKPVVLAMFMGRPRIVRDAVDSARAVVLAYQPGTFAGEALADILFGDVNPSGKLPYSYPRWPGSITAYDRNQSGEFTASDTVGTYNPQWPFGFGLSYTTFAYSDLRVASPQVGMRDTVNVSVVVANTGARAGKEVVQLYVRDLYASVAPPLRRLRAFEKISLAAGERRTVVFRVPVSELAFVGLDNKLVVEPGDFDAIVANLTARFAVR